MSKQVSVYVFEGQGYYGKPGVVFAPAKVSEDMAPYRKATSKDWPKIEAWLLAKGYRCLTKIGRKHDGAEMRQWWGLVSVFGEPKVENGVPVPMSPDEIKSVFNRHIDALKGKSRWAESEGLRLRNQALVLTTQVPVGAQRALLLNDEVQAGLDALDPDSPSFVEDLALQTVIYKGVAAMVADFGSRQWGDDGNPMPSAEDVWGSGDPVRFERRNDRSNIYWIIDRPVDPNEWMVQQQYAPQGYGPGRGWALHPNAVVAGKPVPSWACYVVSHSSNCD